MRANLLPVLMLAIVIPLPLPAMAAPVARAAGVKVPLPHQANKLPHKLIYPGDLFYPEALAKEGVQGVVVLEINLSKDGKARAAKVLSSSKSAKLDKYALDYINTGYYTLPANELKYFEGVYSLNLIFSRDSILTINSKTCADFNTDLRYFRTARAGEALENLAAFELIAGVFTVQLMKTQGASGTLKFVKAVDVINSDTIAGCVKKPGELFVKTYVNAAKKRGVKL